MMEMSPFRKPMMACRGCGREVVAGEEHKYCRPRETAIFLAVVAIELLLGAAVVALEVFNG